MTLFVPTPAQVRALHDKTISAEGGASGLRDLHAFLSVWSRADAARMYGAPDPLSIGALLAHGLIKAHPFADGNKRSAWAAISLTLAGNGWCCDAPPAQAARALIAAAGLPAGAKDLEAVLRPFCRPDPVFQQLFDFDRGMAQDLEP